MTEPAPDPEDHRSFHAAVARAVTEERGADGFPADELGRIAAALRHRTLRSTASNLAGHLRALDMAADIDIDAPTASSRSAGRGVKVAIQRVIGWYVGHLAGQTRQLGVASARAVRAVATRTDELERRLDDLAAPEPPSEPPSEGQP